MTRVFARACAKGENGGVSKVAGLHSEWWHKFIVCGPCAGVGGGGRGKAARHDCIAVLCVRNGMPDQFVDGCSFSFFFFLSSPPPTRSLLLSRRKGGREGGREGGRKEGTYV